MARLYTKSASVAIGARGFLIETGGQRLAVQPPHLVGVKRGKVTSFSSKSIKRLRLALMTAYVDDLSPWGLTLTVPLTVDDWADEWSACVQRFWVACRRLDGFIGAIWRVELQQRGMPHLHLVLWTREEWQVQAVEGLWRQALASWHVQPQTVKRKICGEWVDLCCKTQADGVVDCAMDMSKTRTCSFERLSGTSASVRYLCDHTSKRKQAQLGYQGRQWGIVGRNRLSWLDDGLDLTERQIVLLLRLVRRWSRTWYARHYRGKVSRLRLGWSSERSVPRCLCSGRHELWASPLMRDKVLKWIESQPTEAADASLVSPNAGAWRHGEARGRS